MGAEEAPTSCKIIFMLPSLRIPGVGAHLRVGPVTKTVLKVVASLLLLVVLLYFVDGRKVAAVLAGTNPVWLAVAVVGFLGGQALNALKWHWLGEALALPFSRRRYVQVYFMGLFLAAFLPSSLGGDVGRAVLLGRETRGWAVAYTVLADRYSGMMFLLGLASAACATLGTYDRLKPWLWALSAGVFAAWALLGPLSRRLAGRPFKLAPALGAVADWEERLRTPGHLARVGTSSLAIQLINWGVLVAIALALPMDVPAAALMTAYGLTTLATLAPVSINGLGVREGGYVLLLGMAGVPAEQALGFGALWFAVYTVAALVGGVAWLLPGGRQVKAG